jgi:hypothetical protein
MTKKITLLRAKRLALKALLQAEKRRQKERELLAKDNNFCSCPPPAYPGDELGVCCDCGKPIPHLPIHRLDAGG